MHHSMLFREERFSFLLLDEGEYYVNDYAALYFPLSDGTEEGIKNQIEGVLRVGSKSLIFEPKDCSYPIVKYVYCKITKIEQLKEREFSENYDGCVLLVESEETIHMKEYNLVKPYVFYSPSQLPASKSPFGAADSKCFTHCFGLICSNFANEWQLIHSFYELAAANSPKYDEQVAGLIENLAKQKDFDITWLDSVDEKKLFIVFAVKIMSSMKIPGKILVTNKIIYFQPAANFLVNPVEKYWRCDVVGVKIRRYELQSLTCEIFFLEELESMKSFMSFYYGSGKSILFSFASVSDRDGFYSMVMGDSMKRLGMEDSMQWDEEDYAVAEDNVSLPIITSGPDFQSQIECTSYLHHFFMKNYPSLEVISKWQRGLISNFDYLLYLNLLANRSFNDLTQYPVFPWVLTDYKSQTLNFNNPDIYRDASKPMGALNPARLKHYLQRFNEEFNDGKRFLYGTHYSTPGYVMYYLVRQLPEYMLKFQNGKFDEPDRLFNSIEDAWRNVINNTADLKELIPEFFSVEKKNHQFLHNQMEIDFGICQSGEPVQDVILPAWAANSQDFLKKNRAALESQIFSEQLHEWIDLIFGYKQKGEMALKFHNLYHPLTYQYDDDDDDDDDDSTRTRFKPILPSVLHQVKEFGQTPKQLFFCAHPKRFQTHKPLTINLVKRRAPSSQWIHPINSTLPSTASPSNLSKPAPVLTTISPISPRSSVKSLNTNRVTKHADLIFNQFNSITSSWFNDYPKK